MFTATGLLNSEKTNTTTNNSMKLPRFFSPQCMIEHVHPMVDHWITKGWGNKAEYIPVCVSPPQYEILIHSEGWGDFPVQGSGNKVRCAIPESKGKSQYLLTQAERDAFVAQYFPATWEYEEEQRNNALTAAII